MEFNDSFEDPDFDNTIVPNGVEKKRFLAICRESHRRYCEDQTNLPRPEELLEPHDWKVYASILVQMGMLNLDDDDEDDENVYTERVFSKRGRIDSLRLWASNSRDLQFDLPADIRHLDALDCLVLGDHVEFVPMLQLASLANLTEFRHHRMENLRADSFDGLDHSVNFIKLKSVALSPSTFLMIQDRCVKLESFTIFFNSNEDFDGVVDLLRSSKIRPAETVRVIYIGLFDYDIDPLEPTMQQQENYLERLLLQVAPRFPNLHHLDINLGFDLASFKVVADRIKRDKTCCLSKSLKSLVFSNWWMDGDDPNKYWQALQFFLEASCTIQLFGQPEYEFQYAPPNPPLPRGCQYALIKNTVIRSLLSDGRGCGLPLSVWPILLERVHHHVYNRWEKKRSCCIFSQDDPTCSSEEATGIYHLLREGPALIGRDDLNAASTNNAEVQLTKRE